MLEMLKARKEALQERGVKGFTLMEMLIVIAIIAVLIAIAIPILSGQLENAKEATDAANLRSAYATASVKALEENTGIAAGPVEMTQGDTGWQSGVKDETIGTIKLSEIDSKVSNKAQLYVYVGPDGTMGIGAESDIPSGYTKVNPTTGKS